MSDRDVEQRLPPGICLLSYRISYEAIATTEEMNRRAEALLSEDERQELFDAVRQDPKRAIERLDRLLDELPDAPVFLNWLSAAYNALGNDEKAEEAIRRNYELNPHYLFARANYANVLLRAGDLAGVERALDNKFDLKMLYPERDVFHVSEFLTFSNVVVSYLAKKGNLEPARLLVNSMYDIEPDHELTRAAASTLRSAGLKDLVARTASRMLGRGRVPGT